MIKSFASRIWFRVIFIAYCVVSQEFHPPVYLQTLKNCRVNDKLVEDKVSVLQGIFSKPTSSCANNFSQSANYEVFIPQRFFLY